ncbi:hypothetical protein BGZ92_010886, partial [Podila epicladia]
MTHSASTIHAHSAPTILATPNNNVLTTSNGNPVDDNQNSMTAGEFGPVLLQDFHLIDKLAHFDRERIPERVVHAKGAGAHGYFEVTADLSKLTAAKFLRTPGIKTPIFARFSTVGGEKGSSDSARDHRGFAVNRKSADMFWDFISLSHETLHQVTILMSNRGTPYSYRHMDGFSSHALKLVNAEGEAHLVKWHFKTDQGIKNHSAEEAAALDGSNPDSATEDLFESIAKGDHPSWTVYLQVMKEADAANYKWNVFDVTKVWPHKDYPLQKIGKMVLNRNPINYFAEVEQAAFSPSHMVPGIDVSNDKIRLGANYLQLPINQPYRARINHHQRDGPQNFSENFHGLPNYEPQSHDSAGPQQQLNYVAAKFSRVQLNGQTGRYPHKTIEDDYIQPGDLYRLMKGKEQDDL